MNTLSELESKIRLLVSTNKFQLDLIRIKTQGTHRLMEFLSFFYVTQFKDFTSLYPYDLQSFKLATSSLDLQFSRRNDPDQLIAPFLELIDKRNRYRRGLVGLTLPIILSLVLNGYAGKYCSQLCC